MCFRPVLYDLPFVPPPTLRVHYLLKESRYYNFLSFSSIKDLCLLSPYAVGKKLSPNSLVFVVFVRMFLITEDNLRKSTPISSMSVWQRFLKESLAHNDKSKSVVYNLVLCVAGLFCSRCCSRSSPSCRPPTSFRPWDSWQLSALSTCPVSVSSISSKQCLESGAFLVHHCR